MFWNKKPEVKPMNSDEYEKLRKDIIDLETKLKKIELSNVNLEQFLKNLRGIVNRKLGIEDKPEASEESPKPQDINKPKTPFD